MINERVAIRPRALLLLGLLVACSFAVLAGVSAGRAQALSYCGVWVPPYTGCANVPGGSWVNGYFNENWAHAQHSLVGEGGTGIPVCERTFIVGGSEVSYRCEEVNAYSDCDLYYYHQHGYELSAHVINDWAFEELDWGHTKTVTEYACA